MLIKFESKHSGDFIMFSAIALPLLKMMGTGGNAEGAVSGENLSTALASLEAALQRLKQQAEAPAAQTEENEEEEVPVALATRALPLLEMLRKAQKNEGFVMWRPE